MPAPVHQRDFCLTASYSECPLISTKTIKHLPEELRFPDANPRKKSLSRLITRIGIIALVAIIIFIGLSNPDVREKIKSVFARTTYEAAPLVIPRTKTRVEFFTPTQPRVYALFPTFTPRPTRTATELPVILSTPVPSPTLIQTPTPACDFSIAHIGISYFSGNMIQLSYETNVDLREYRVLDASGQPTARLTLPGFKLFREGSQVYMYGTYLRDPSAPTRLYLEMIAAKNDQVKIIFTDANGLHCSKPLLVADKNLFITPTAPQPVSTLISPTLTLIPPATTPVPPIATPSPSDIPVTSTVPPTLAWNRNAFTPTPIGAPATGQ
ncbi:MAG: hypothetical protein WA110_02270 [Anaerolineaceae bacterium]